MGLIKFYKEGSWWVTSESDPRWDGSGSSSIDGFTYPPEHIEEKKKELEEDPPDDLEYGYMKN